MQGLRELQSDIKNAGSMGQYLLFGIRTGARFSRHPELDSNLPAPFESVVSCPVSRRDGDSTAEGKSVCGGSMDFVPETWGPQAPELCPMLPQG
jgi:hypothetical protein